MKTTTITVTKQDILTAIKTEPLVAGVWIRINDPSELDMPASQAKSCTVCAVGGLLRSKLRNASQDLVTSVACAYTDDSVTDYSGAPTVEGAVQEAKGGIASGEHLAALSCLFETLCERFAMDEVRTRLSEYVIELFPDSFEIEVDESVS